MNGELFGKARGCARRDTKENKTENLMKTIVSSRGFKADTYRIRGITQKPLSS